MTLRPSHTRIAFWALAGLALLYEGASLAIGENATFSQYIWNASSNPFFVFAFGVLGGHFFFRKSKCESCGADPYIFPKEPRK